MASTDTGDPTATGRADLLAARRALAERLAVEPRAYSIDGRTFHFQAPLAAEIPVGGFVTLRTEGGPANSNSNSYLGQVLTKEVAQREGPEISLEGDAGLGVALGSARVAQTAFRVRLEHVEGGGVLLGRVDGDAVAPPGPSDLFEEAAIAVAADDDIARYLQARTRGRTVLEIGTVRHGAGTARAALLADGFDRHTFLCGQSGSGKTFALGVILERLLLETDLRLVVIDPNSDYVRLGETRPLAELAARWPGGMDEASYAALRDRHRAATAGLRVLRPARRGTSAPDALRVRFGDLTPEVQGLVLRLDPLADREEYNAFRSIAARTGRSDYSLADVRAAAAADLSADARRVALRMANLGVADWDLWAEGDEPSLAGLADRAADWRALGLDIGGFATAAEKSLVASATLGLLWARREERRPTLIVIDEAHNVCPAEPTDALQQTATERAVRIAGEGRKFGLYLLLATQRPQKLHPNVLSQCDNLVLMRMNSEADLAHMRAVFSFVPGALLERASAFAQGESLLAGKIVPSPLPARFEGRLTPEGGGDVPADWARPR